MNDVFFTLASDVNKTVCFVSVGKELSDKYYEHYFVGFILSMIIAIIINTLL